MYIRYIGQFAFINMRWVLTYYVFINFGEDENLHFYINYTSLAGGYYEILFNP